MPPINKSVVPGITLIVLGIIFLLPNFTSLEARDLWPILILGPGILFYIMFFQDRTNYGLLMPATVLTASGLLFFYCVSEGWHMMRTLWPIMMIAPGAAFMLMYIWGKKENALLVPGIVLTLLGGLFLIAATDYDYLWPVALIVLGIVLLFGARRKNPDAP